ncbi:MAG: cell wall-binding repeat-containing protein, partial [Acidimicrobiaceae bacterium]|nr:cell wall-binding repeat-containing protein [Acidimicrobiaceae bacterium]
FRAGVAPHQGGARLIDTNGDGVPDSREFAGSHRYNTAVALAERFAKDEGAVSTVILASGETQVDAVTAAGLAGNLNAPVLLTRSSMLPHNVARFIDENNVTDVVIVGGTAAVPDRIVTAVESLGSRPNVERVSGADRYATAAAIGSRIAGPSPTWCGSTQPAAILVNGGDAGRADAVVSGPLAFRLALPVLLTSADMLPDSTEAFLTDNKIERVVIVGGTGAVSAGVVDTLVEDVGVVRVQRIAGSSVADTSVKIAKEMMSTACSAVLSTNPDMVALVNRDAIADGIAAAPVMGRGIGGGGTVPILLVGDDLPAEVSDYLASTPDMRAGHGKTHMSIVAVGGTAVVSNAVMADAVAAATTSSMLTAEIMPVKYTAATLRAAKVDSNTGDALDPATTTTDSHGCALAVTLLKAVGDYSCQFRVKFSDDVKLAKDGPDTDTTVSDDERRGTVEDPTMYRINGRRLAASGATAASDEPVSLNALIWTADRTVTITLSHHLMAGNTIAVDNSHNEAKNMRLGANRDMRKLEPSSVTLGAATTMADRSAPLVEILAVAGSQTFDVIVTEPAFAHDELAGSHWRNYVTVKGQSKTGDSRKAADFESAGTKAPAPDSDVGRQGTTHRRYTVSVDKALKAGDIVSIHARTFVDRSGRYNRGVDAKVAAAKSNTVKPADPNGTGYLEVSSVTMGDYVHHMQAMATIGSDRTSPTDMTVKAKATGIASGARGNGWAIYGYDDRTLSDSRFKIDVAVDTTHQRISYTISDVLPAKPHREPQIGDLAAALVKNSTFAANFAVVWAGTERDRTATLTDTNPDGVMLQGGKSKVGVVVKFNAPLASLDTDGDTLASNIALKINMDANPADVIDVAWAPPDSQVHITYTSTSMARLPQRSGFRVITADVAYTYNATGTAYTNDNAGNMRELLSNLRRDPNIKPN